MRKFLGKFKRSTPAPRVPTYEPTLDESFMRLLIDTHEQRARFNQGRWS